MKWLPLLAAGLFALATVLWLARDPTLAHELYGIGSSLDFADHGTSRLRAYMEGPGQLHVTTLARPLGHEAISPTGVVFRLRPRVHSLALREFISPNRPVPAAEPGSLLTADEERWVTGGGRLILAIDDPYHGMRRVPVSGPLQHVLPISDYAWELAPSSVYALAGPVIESAVAFIVAENQPVVMRQPRGAGEVWLLAIPEIWSNQHLAQRDHLAFALALADHRPVWFDESVHALSRDVGPFELAKQWGLGPFLLLGLISCLAYAWRNHRIIGPPADTWRDHRSESVDGIAALAVLYGRALTDRALLALFQRRLVRETALLLGLSPVKANELVQRQLGPYPVTSTTTSTTTVKPTAAAFTARLHLLVTAYRKLRHEHRRRRC